MGRETLRLIYNRGVTEPRRKSVRINLDNESDFKLTNLSIERPARNFIFDKDRLRMVTLDDGLALQVFSSDADGVIRHQTFQCDNPDTIIKLRYSSPEEERRITLEFDRNPDRKTPLLLVK